MIEELFGLLSRGLWQLIKLFIKFLRKHPRYAFLLPFLVIAAYFRFITISSSTLFLGITPDDKHIITNLLGGNLIFLGRLLQPGNITLGPFYEYLIALPVWIFGADPIWPAFLSGMLSVASVYLLYRIGKQFFNLQVGLFAAGLYAFSPFTFSYVHQSWNVDLLPFFSLLLLWLIFNAAASARPLIYYLLAGYVLGLCLQLQYVAIFLVFLVFLYMIVTEIIVKGKNFIVPFSLHFLELLGGLFFSSIPFLYYEALKGFPNTIAFGNYLFQTAHNAPLSHLLLSMLPMLSMLFARLVIHFPSPDAILYYSPTQVTILTDFAAVLLAVSFLILFFARNRFAILAVILWLLFGSFSFSFFVNDTYDYHFSFLYPVLFLLVGNFLGFIFHLGDQERVRMEKQLISQNVESETYTMIPVDVTDNKKLIFHSIAVGFSVLLFFIIILLDTAVLPYHFESKAQAAEIQNVSKFIVGKAEKNPFNLSLLTPPNTSVDLAAYTASMEKLGNKPVTIQHAEIDPEKKTVTDFLYVVCEGQQCKPLDSTRWSIKGFGNAAIIAHWGVGNTTVYKLVHVIIHN